MPFESQLLGKRILVAEDDQNLARSISRELADLGATVLGPAPTPFYALSLITRRGVDLAVLNLKLYKSTVFEVADELISRGSPIIFIRGPGSPTIPVRFGSITVLEKPTDLETLTKLAVAMTGIVVTPPIPPAPSLQPEASLSLEHREVGDRLMGAVCRAMAETWDLEEPSSPSVDIANDRDDGMMGASRLQD